jgi:hypothetical protein
MGMVAEIVALFRFITSIAPGDWPGTGASATAAYAVEASGEMVMLSVAPGNVTFVVELSLAFVTIATVLSDTPNASVTFLLGASTSRPGRFVELINAVERRSLLASMMKSPAPTPVGTPSTCPQKHPEKRKPER